MTDDVPNSGPNGGSDGSARGEPAAATSPVWPAPFPVAPPTPALGPTVPDQQAVRGGIGPAPVPAPGGWAPAPPVAAPPAAGYPSAGYPLTSFPPAGRPPTEMRAPAGGTAKAERAAPWAVGVPAPRPPVAGPPPAVVPQPPTMPPYGGGYGGPPFAIPPQVAPPSRGRGRSGVGRGVLIALTLVLVAGLAGGTTWFVLRDDPTAQTGDSTTQGAPLPGSSAGSNHPRSSLPGGASVSSAPSRSSAPTSSAPATPTAMTEQQALDELGALRTDSLPRLVTDGRWVAQVASKSVGITDPLQTASNGTHTFYAVDILAESKAVTSSVPVSAVLVLQSTDFGKISHAPDGQAYWITVVDEGFGGSDQVKSWCASTYPTLTPEQLADSCAPRTLSPPHN